MVYTVKFSNGLYIMNPYFAFGSDSVEGTLTTNLSKARLLDDISSAERYAKIVLERCERFPHLNKAVAGCTYEIVEVKVIEVKGED